MPTMPSGPSFREHRAFERLARDLVRLPGPGEDPLAYLLSEARWRELTSQVPDEAAWLMALSRATGVYFFPSREWVQTLMRYLKLLGVTRLLEAGAGRGYLTAALMPLCAAAGIRFRAVDSGDGEFVSGLPVFSGVERASALTAARELRPQVIVYAWPPPGQSVSPLCQMDFLHYLILIGEAGGGATGAREDWGAFAPPGFSGPVPVRPGAHRGVEPPGDRLLRRRPTVPLTLPDGKG